MKKITASLILICSFTGLFAQSSFTIHPETAVTITGNTPVVLHEMNLVNNGLFLPGNSSLFMTGHSKGMITGNSLTPFYHLSVFNTKGFQLGNHISIDHLLEMGAPVEVQRYSILLGKSAGIVQENETNRFTDVAGNGGYETTTRNFNTALTNIHPGNLGVEFVQAPLLGNTTITRYNSAFQVASFTKPINRYYRIHAANSTAQNAALRFYYFDHELNAADEETLFLWKSTDNGRTWTYLQPNSRNTNLNFVEINHTDVSALWTIGNYKSMQPLPITSFNNNCSDEGTTLSWSIPDSKNKLRFTVEKSTDAKSWKAIAQMEATDLHQYMFTDAEAGPAYYRLKQTGTEGMSTYSANVYSSCTAKESMLMLYPNPANEYTDLVFQSKESYTTQIQIYSSNGQLIKTIQTSILKGANKIRVDLLELSNGSYTIKIEDEQLRMSKPFIKQ